MISKYGWITIIAVVTSLCAAGSAFATNGYYTHGTGTKNKSMAGSGMALPEDSIDIVNNPAVAPFVGDQLIVGAAVFSPIRKYTTSESLVNGNFGRPQTTGQSGWSANQECTTGGPRICNGLPERSDRRSDWAGNQWTTGGNRC